MSKGKEIVLGVFFLLYVVIVWVCSALFLTGSTLFAVGLVLTACGATLLTVYVLISRMSGGQKSTPSAAGVEAKPAIPSPSQDADSNVLKALLAEANERLARSSKLASQRVKTRLTDLPLYILMGPEGAGKTTALLQSGLEPELLAGQVFRDDTVLPTQLCNLWFSRDSLVAEAAGRFLV